jgi:N-acetylneuraminic acid mutarotase
MMTVRLIRPWTLVFSGLAMISCNDETTAPEPVTDEATTGPSLATAASTRWVTKAHMLAPERSGLASAVVTNSAGQSLVYAIGGSSSGSLSTVHEYNASEDRWRYKRPLPAPRYWTNGAGVINGKIYISGGLSGNKNYHAELFVYDPGTNRWTQKRNMPGMSFAGVTGVINNKLYVVTQCEQEDCDVFSRGSLYRYDPVTDLWETLTPPPFGYSSWSQGATIGGKLYVTGRGQGRPVLQVYDPVTNGWAVKTGLNRHRWLGAGVAVSGKLYVIGGFSDNADASNPVPTVSVYDPATDSWTNKHPLPSGRFNITASRVVIGGRARIHVLGGARPNNLQLTP